MDEIQISFFYVRRISYPTFHIYRQSVPAVDRLAWSELGGMLDNIISLLDSYITSYFQTRAYRHFADGFAEQIVSSKQPWRGRDLAFKKVGKLSDPCR